MPMAAMSLGSYWLLLLHFKIACFTCSHHRSGLCSAQPDCTEIISTSVSGNCAEAMHTSVSALTTETFIEFLRKAFQNNNMHQVYKLLDKITVVSQKFINELPVIAFL